MDIKAFVCLFLFYSSVAMAQSPGASPSYGNGGSCSYATQDVRSLTDTIRENFKQRDVSYEVDRFQGIVSRCKLNLANMGFGSGIYDFWKNEGYKAEIKKTQEDAEYYAHFRNVDAELAKYKDLATKLGYPNKDIQKFLNDKSVQGKASQNKEPNSCKQQINISDKLGPVRDQDSVGWCFAFTAADLISFKLGKKISAFDLALGSYDNFWDNVHKFFGKKESDFNGGIPSDAIEQDSERGFCLEQNLKSEDNGTSDLLYTLKQVEATKEKHYGIQSECNCSKPFVSASRIFANVSAKDFNDIVEKTAQQDLINSLANKTCQPRIHPKPKLEVKSNGAIDSDGKAKVFDTVDEQLSKGRPIMIGYNSKVLYNVNANGDTDHGSIIVGRRWNPQKQSCEYLIRNSWGRGCSSYDPSLECNQGNVWVPKSALGRSQGAVYVQWIE